jgi:hypothetical protein
MIIRFVFGMSNNAEEFLIQKLIRKKEKGKEEVKELEL